jgi:hypothetical protein
MKKGQVKPGDLVVVNKLPDATVYTVKEIINDYNAVLTYKVGEKTVSGGGIDISCLRKPTKAQLNQ